MAARTSKSTTETAETTQDTTVPKVEFPTAERAADADALAKAGKEAPKVVSVNEEEDVVTVQAVNVEDIPAVSRLLLDSTEGRPEVVTAVSSPKGWQVPVSVAKSAGVI